MAGIHGTYPGNNMLRDKAVIGYLGLLKREILVIQSIFTLTEKFHNTYELPRENERRSADVVFVNADDEEQIDAWHQFALKKPSAIPVYISTEGREFNDGLTLKRPLVLKKLIDALTIVKECYTTTIASQNPTAVNRGRFNILVVDDSLPVRVHMEQKLSSLLPVVTEIDFASSGDEAIDLLKDRKHYDIIFMDVIMPGTDGYKTCKWIKANRPNYVVMLTSRSSPFDKVRGAMSGCDAYLVKPPQDSELEKILQRRIGDITDAGESVGYKSRISTR